LKVTIITIELTILQKLNLFLINRWKYEHVVG